MDEDDEINDENIENPEEDADLEDDVVPIFKKNTGIMQTSTLLKDSLGIQKGVPQDYFIKLSKIPIGTMRPLSKYKTKAEMLKEVVYFPLNLQYGDATSILFVGSPGTFKSTMAKRFIDYFYNSGALCCAFDLGSESLSTTMGYKGSGQRLHPYEKPNALPVVNYLPYYVIQNETGGVILDEHKKSTIFSEDVNEYKEVQDWTNFGLSDNAINYILTALSKKKTTKDIQKALLSRKDKTIQKMGTAHGTRQSLSGRMGRLLSGGYFKDNYDAMDMISHWYNSVGNTYSKKRNGEIPLVTFKGVEPTWMSNIYHKTLVKIRRFCVDSRMYDPKLFFVDDAQLVCGTEMDETNSAVMTTKNSLEIWRKFGFNMMFATQRPDRINPVVPSTVKWIFCSRVNDLSFLKNRTTFDKTILRVISNLEYDPGRHLVQWIMVYPNQYRYETYYPFYSRQLMFSK